MLGDRITQLYGNRIEPFSDTIKGATGLRKTGRSHPFRALKRKFGHTKARYSGLAKSAAQIVTLFALSNLWSARRKLLEAQG